MSFKPFSLKVNILFIQVSILRAYYTNFQIMSQEMYSTIMLLMKKRQQAEVAMANLDVDKVSRQEKREEILLLMVKDVLPLKLLTRKSSTRERGKARRNIPR